MDEEPVEFGITKPLNSFNPVQANVHIFLDMIRDFRATNSGSDKWKIWISRTGWRPADIVDTPAPSAEKFDPKCARQASSYALALLVGMTLWGSFYLFTFAELPYADRAIGFAVLLLTLVEAGAAVEGESIQRTDILRRALLLPALAYLWWSTSGVVSLLYPIYALFLTLSWTSLSRTPFSWPGI